MREGVIANLMTFRVRLSEQGEMRFGVLANDEERARRSSRPQGVENCACPRAIRPVVEGEGDAMRAVTGALDDVRHGKLHVSLVADHPRCRVESDLPQTHRWPMFDAQNLARS